MEMEDKMFKYLFLFAMTMAILAGCQPKETEIEQAEGDVKVYIMRGLFGFLFQESGGVYRMRDELIAKGYDVDFQCWQIPCRQQIIEDIKANPDRKFVIIGHSMGGNGVTLIGEELAELGIEIPYAAVIDAPM